jgi:hypothetical protein
VRSGKYFFGSRTSWDRGLDVTITWLFRQAQAFGFPVVPEVYIRTERSLGVPLAHGVITAGCGRLSRFIYKTPVVFGAAMSWKDDRLIEICLKSVLIAPARS